MLSAGRKVFFLCALPMRVALGGSGSETQDMCSSLSALGFFLVHNGLGDFFLPLPKRESNGLGREFSSVCCVLTSLSSGIPCAGRRSPPTLGEAGERHRASGFRAKVSWVQDWCRNCPKEVTCIKS